MSEPAIQVEAIAKQYRIGARRERPKTLREALVRAASAPLHNFRHLRSLGSPGGDGASLIWALRDVSFEVAQGEVLGIIGRNGAGKSTLLKILSRITYPTTGRARVHGRIGSLLEIGTGFHPELSGRDNIYLNGCILGMDRAYISKRFDQIVEFADVAVFLDTPVKHYSSGMYLRLAFAVAAHLGSEVLIIDEVLAVGDAEFQAKCLAKLQEVAVEGRTVLFVSHNLNAIQRMCPRSILLDGGELVADGPTAEVLQRYLAQAPDAPAPASWIDLSGAHRTGSREVQIEAVQFSGDRASLDYQAYPDGPLELKLAIRSDLQRMIGGIGVAIQGETGTKLLTVETLSLGLVTPVEKGRTLLGLRIDSLHLNPGVYSVGLWVTGPLGRKIFDRIDPAFMLQVADPEPEISGRRAPGSITCRFAVLPQEFPAD